MRLLIIGTLEGHVTAAAKIAINNGAKVTHISDTEKALQAIRNGKGADLVLIDFVLDVQGFLKALATERITLPVVACGVSPDPDKAAAAIRSGAKEYISLPPDPEMIAAVLEAVSNQDQNFIHRDKKTAELLKFADRIAPSEASVLITGESGTGKEVMARYIHNNSRRKDAPFVSLNCAAIPENLLESELFGHEKGAFTGAIASRVGKFEEANCGTLLLDEITEMHPRLQAKLLRAIQERVIDRVGGSQPIHVNIRIIATSNRNMAESVKSQVFREDLYFRLNVVNINMPPLRERVMDIHPLAEYFLEKYCKLNHLERKKISSEAVKAINVHDWPGNVRELENAIHRGALLSQSSMIQPEDIFGLHGPTRNNYKSDASTPIMVGKTVSEVEKELILNTLDHCLGNRTHAANILGISIRTLRNKLKEYRENTAESFVTQ